MTSLVCLLEKPSAAEMLKGVLPRLLPEITTTFITFEGKQDLEKRFVKRIKFWQDPKAVFLVMRDQDSGNCKTIKKRLMKMVQETGKPLKNPEFIDGWLLPESFRIGSNRAFYGSGAGNKPFRQFSGSVEWPQAFVQECLKMNVLLI